MTETAYQRAKARYTPQQRVELARQAERPNIHDYCAALFDDLFVLRGDRLYGDDHAVFCAIARYRGLPVTVAGHVKGRNLEDNIHCNFGMPNPEGYRKFQRVAAQSAKFGRPLLTFIDTPGAYPGQEAEERGQGEAIANCLYLLSNLPVPVIAVVTGEGGSGGALAFGVADRVLMLENAIYSVLSPEGFASILWKDAKRSDEACALMKLTAFDLYEGRVIDRIIAEPAGGAGADPVAACTAVDAAIWEELAPLLAVDAATLTKKRYQKFRAIGAPQ